MRRRLSGRLIAAAALMAALAVPAAAQTDGGAPADDSAEAATPAEAAPAAATAPADEPATPEVGSNADLLEKGKEVKGAVDELRGDSEVPRKFLIAALIAALCNLLLSAIKRGLKLDKGKKWLPRIALGLGVVVGVTTYFVPGTTLVEALIYGGGPPGAIIIQEVFPLLRSKGATEATDV